MGAFQDLLLANHAIDVRVDYYDQREEKCFGSYPNAAEIHKIAGTTVSIPLAEFLTYSLFVNKRPQLVGLRSFSEIKANLNDYVGDFNAGLRVDEGSLSTVLTGNDQVSDLSHKIGTGAALSVANRIIGLNEADWNRISVGPVKAEDFWFSSPLTGHVEVEAKGSSLTNHVGPKPDTVRQHAVSIREKFATSRARPAGYPSTRYGVIAAVDTRPDSIMQSWLVDPPGGTHERNPRDQQILNRLFFVAEVLEAILPQAFLAMDLYKRIAVISQLDDIFAYDRVSLSGSAESWRQAIFYTQPHEPDRRFFGTIITLKDGTRFFYGLRTEWIDAVQSQDFERIATLDGVSGSQSLALTIPGRFEEKYDEGRRIAADKSLRTRTEIAHVHIASSGRVFGIVGQWAGRQGIHELDDS